MREFAKVSPQIWINELGKQLKKLGCKAQVIAFYLSTNPHASMIGIYYLPIAFISHELGILYEEVVSTLKQLIEIDYCSYDEKLEYIWVHEMGFEQIDTQLKLADHRVKHVNDMIAALPELPFLKKFLDKYAEPFHIKCKESEIRGLEAPSKPLRSKEKETENDIEKEEDKEMSAELQNSSASETYVISIPLKNNHGHLITSSQIEEWQRTFNQIDVKQVLKVIQSWNVANPKRRKCKNGIMRHITLWLTREQEKAQNKGNESKSLFTYNQSIADEWLKCSSHLESEEMH